MQFKVTRILILGSLLLSLLSCAKGRTKAPCGDGVCEAGETWETCSADCLPPCGDGVAQGPEDCDGDRKSTRLNSSH